MFYLSNVFYVCYVSSGTLKMTDMKMEQKTSRKESVPDSSCATGVDRLMEITVGMGMNGVLFGSHVYFPI